MGLVPFEKAKNFFLSVYSAYSVVESLVCGYAALGSLWLTAPCLPSAFISEDQRLKNPLCPHLCVLCALCG